MAAVAVILVVLLEEEQVPSWWSSCGADWSLRLLVFVVEIFVGPANDFVAVMSSEADINNRKVDDWSMSSLALALFVFMSLHRHGQINPLPLQVCCAGLVGESWFCFTCFEVRRTQEERSQKIQTTV